LLGAVIFPQINEDALLSPLDAIDKNCQEEMEFKTKTRERMEVVNAVRNFSWAFIKNAGRITKDIRL
jgi:hypothetical protein